MTSCQIRLPAKWISADALDAALTGASPHTSAPDSLIHIVVPAGCAIMVDAAVRLLSLANQLAFSTRSVRLEFVDGEDGTMGYLNRVGFFDHLSADVAVLPSRPAFSGAEIYRGANSGLVEIARINPRAVQQDLPAILSERLAQAYKGPADANDLEGAAFTIFSELIGNVFDHSGTHLDGYAALQVYQKGKHATVSVSDSGLGLMETLRPSLASEFPELVGRSDTDLLVEVFRQGVSRHGKSRGCGLKGCAEKAVKFTADLNVRLPHTRVLLKPGKQGYSRNTAYCSANLPLVWGTHISFHFPA